MNLVSCECCRGVFYADQVKWITITETFGTRQVALCNDGSDKQCAEHFERDGRCLSQSRANGGA